MQRSSASLTIAISGTDSETVVVPSGFVLSAIRTPGTLTGSSFSLKGAESISAASLAPVYNGGSLYSTIMGTNRMIPLDTTITKNLTTFALVSSSTEAAARTFVAIFTRE